MKRLVYSVVIAASISHLVLNASADVPDLSWGEPQAIDADVLALPSSSGASAASARGRWWVAYEKGGDIFCADRDTSGGSWNIRRLTLDAALQTNPHIAANGQVYVVWEEHGGMHPEVWARRMLGDGWEPATCLSCDDTPSRRPVIDAKREYGVDPIVAWEDSTPAGFRIVGGRYGHTWDRVSSPVSNARDPSVCDRPDGGIFTWTDDRHGVPQIYRRTEGMPEQRTSFLPFACFHPSVKNGICQEFSSGPPFVLFEGEPHESGVTEVYAAPCADAEATMISADDGIPSIDPNVDLIQVDHWPCYMMPFTTATYLTTWTDRPPGGAARHWLDGSSCCSVPGGGDLLPAPGLSRSAIAAVEGEPHAAVLQLWIEDREGRPTLMCRTGYAPGCESPAVGGPPAFVVAPEGIPSNAIRFFDECSGEPYEENMISWYMDPGVEGDLTWDPDQPHSGTEWTDEHGEAVLAIHAGGCSQAGNVWVTASCVMSQPTASWPGVRSPDIDGDCEVDLDDLAYVQSRSGTDDFCADLDGSHSVGPEDVAIVEATLGQHCSNVESDVGGEGAALAGEPVLRVYPNPCTERARFEILTPQAGPVMIDVIDAGGRRLRTIDAAPADGRGGVEWDLRDEAGRAAPAGIYFVMVRFERKTLRHPLVVCE